MPRTSTATALIILWTVLMGADGGDFTAYENEKYGYGLDIPAGFVMQGDWGTQTSWIYLPGEEEKNTEAVFPIISVIASTIPSRFSASTLYNTKMKKVQEMIDAKDSGYEDLETVTVEGGYALMYKEVNKDDPQSLNRWFVNVYGNGRYYIIEISGTRQQLRERRSELGHVVESFRLIR
jgi:hypothetical protein